MKSPIFKSSRHHFGSLKIVKIINYQKEKILLIGNHSNRYFDTHIHPLLISERWRLQRHKVFVSQGGYLISMFMIMTGELLRSSQSTSLVVQLMWTDYAYNL